MPAKPVTWKVTITKVTLPAEHGGIGIRSHLRDCLMTKLQSRPVLSRWLTIWRRELIFMALLKSLKIITWAFLLTGRPTPAMPAKVLHRFGTGRSKLQFCGFENPH
jgi:hypothetical protein